MPVRLAACDPCRTAKVSCDHAVPCGRCKENERTGDCTYRERPFKRRRVQQDTPESSVPPYQPADLQRTPLVDESPSTTPVYPNPGYQGVSSHTSIFDQVKASGGGAGGLTLTDISSSNDTGVDLEDYDVVRHNKLLEEIRQLDLKACAKLISCWLSQGVNLALAGPFVQPCIEAICSIFSTASGAELVALLSRSSRRRSVSSGTMAIQEYCENSCRNDPGWATLGMFLVALSRAAEDKTHSPLLYRAWAGQQKLQKLALQHADQCLEICLSLDCLNDLQLMLQYENFIAHSMIDGDQSYHSWRRLGDVVSSLYALGYHERVAITALDSVTLESLRTAAFCRAYSADKNVSIFLGRPPRMHRNHSALKLASEDIPLLFDDDASLLGVFEYAQETRWTVACAILKERVLDLARIGDDALRGQESSKILQDCIALQAVLPPRYHLPGQLKDFQGSAVERDFVASAALNALHVRFLLHSSFMQRASEPSDELVSVSATMLKLAAEVAVLKPTLVNSGTGFIWKIVFYGLPAAGILCLALVNRNSQSSRTSFPVSQAMQDLSVLVAHFEAGVLISPNEANYALLKAATVTIKTVMQKLTSGLLTLDVHHETSAEQVNSAPDLWMPWAGENESLDFELDFWTHLAEHPALFQDAA